MKVLLTGASGFVGSHILDAFCARQISTAVLLRPTSSRAFIQSHLESPASANTPRVEVRSGSITDPASLVPALEDITHVVHCAGCTRARTKQGFFDVNQFGTRNMVEAVNRRGNQIRQFIHISSLAVTGPAPRTKPAKEEDPTAPISDYGDSKLAAELEVRDRCRVPFTVLRPPAVYGPRDSGFFTMFQAVHRHLLPQPSATQFLSLVFGPDLGVAVAGCVDQPAAMGQTYFVASPEIVTGRQMAEEIARQIGHWTVPCPLPPVLLWPVCLGQEIFARITGRAMLLNLQKYAELRAPGWVCDASKLKKEAGIECLTPLQKGVAATLEWYRKNQWLR